MAVEEGEMAGAGSRERMEARVKLNKLAWIIAFWLAGSCSPPKTKMFLVLNFDVEDYTTPVSEGIDEIPKWLAETMTEEGVTGTFYVIGEKARSLESRGRRDVITAMAKHDIGSHTNHGSIHPTVTEQLEKAGWEDGVRLMAEQESAGIKDLERIFGVSVKTLARHGGSYGPQLVCALGQLGAGYSGSPVHLPGRDVVWFCNALNFTSQYDGFDDTYYRDDLFEPRFAKLKAELPELAKTTDALSFFAGHPTKIRAEQFWDFNYYEGRNPGPEEWKTPELRPLESMKTARANFRRMVRYLKSRNDIEITTFRTLMDVYGHQKELMTKAELREIAENTIQNKTILGGEYFSPAEAFAGLAGAIFEYKNKGLLPQEIKADHPLGPVEMPDFQPEISRVTLQEVYELAGLANEHIRQVGSLPSSLEARSSRIGAGSLFALFSSIYLDMISKSPHSEYKVPIFYPYPRTNEEEIVQAVRDLKSWPVHRPDLDMNRIVELTKLQLWTLKPAHRK
jgi:peptidoglycan/xylan/chitin deacetylase (PgdA/CDA1 family)